MPKLTPYTRTKPSVNAVSAKRLSAVNAYPVRGTFIKSPPLKSVATPFALAGVAYDGYSQYKQDSTRTDLDAAQRAGRVSLSVSASSGIAATSIAVGTTIGTAIPVPVLGTAVGFATGAVVGFTLQWAWDKYGKDRAFEAFGFD